jgi:CHAT domain-containing protein
MNFIHFQIILLCWLFTYMAYATSENVIDEGQQAFNQGNFEQAIAQWQTAIPQLMPAQQVKVFNQLATAYRNLGQYNQAFKILQQAEKVAQGHKYFADYAMILCKLSELYIATQQFEPANLAIAKALKVARKSGQSLVLAHVLNHQGNWLVTQANYLQALAVYEESARLAKPSGDEVLASKTLLNQLQVILLQKDYVTLLAKLPPAEQQLQHLPDNYDKAFNFIILGRLAQRSLASVHRSQFMLIAYRAFEQAKQAAVRLPNSRLSAYAYGYLGELYQDDQRYEEALYFTQQAVFFAQQANMEDNLYRWYWQQGRLLKIQGQEIAAIRSYQQAIIHLRTMRHTANQASSVPLPLETIYVELTDLLLEQAHHADSVERQKSWLIQARDTIEQLKARELQNYFQDDCVTSLQAKMTSLEGVDKHAAVLYPITLPKRTELLLSLPTGDIQQFTIAVDEEVLRQTVYEFREQLTNRTHYQFVPPAQQLYQWLIMPLLATLRVQQVDTLIVVPNNFLRTIPLAALYDGEQFLIEQFALAITPGITLTEPKPIKTQQVQVLLGGLTEGVQDFDPLPHVNEELRQLQGLFAANQYNLLKNQDFSLAKLQEVFQSTPYSIIHIASHGQFDKDPNKTFLLTYDGKLTINQLERLMRLSEFREEPVELLTLSACQTAVGDEQAALGLAGVALKAGARSAIATLWFINDMAASTLVTEFYRQLQQFSISKAKALQNAQKMMLHHPQLQHPAFWSAFLLIGNWL